jgi:hypothetical protein
LAQFGPSIETAGIGYLGKTIGDIAARTAGGPQREKNIAGALGGLASGAATGALWGSYVPLPGVGTFVGGLVGALFGGISASTKKCIIVTACCGENSNEVKIAREYRDHYMDKHCQRGYYYIAEQLVPLMEESPLLRDYIRSNLVMPLIRFGNFKLGHTLDHPSSLDCAITKNFLGLCRDIGNIIPEFQRSNGEVI